MRIDQTPPGMMWVQLSYWDRLRALVAGRWYEARKGEALVPDPLAEAAARRKAYEDRVRPRE